MPGAASGSPLFRSGKGSEPTLGLPVGGPSGQPSGRLRGTWFIGMVDAFAISMSSTPPTCGGGSPLLESVKQALVLRHYSPRTVESYVGWVRRFILFHHRRHPRSMGASEVSAFLSVLATRGRSAPLHRTRLWQPCFFCTRTSYNSRSNPSVRSSTRSAPLVCQW